MLAKKTRATDVQDPLIPLAVLENAIRYWWIVALLITVGGIFGWFVHSLVPPLYEGSAQFSTAIDFVSTGPLTQYEEDLAINTVGQVFASNEVLQQVVDQAVKEGIETDINDLRKQIYIERKFSEWTIRVRDPNPQVAERLALIWLNQGEAIIQQSYHHAIQAYHLEGYIRSLESCLEKTVVTEPTYSPCNSGNFTNIQKNLYDASAALFNERQASRGLFAGLIFGPFNPQEVSQKPVNSGRNQFIFLGAFAGLLASIAILETGLLNFFRRKG